MADEPECDIFAAVTAFCNGNQLEDAFASIQQEVDRDEELDSIAEIEKLTEYKSTRKKSSRRGRKAAGNDKPEETDSALPASRPAGRGRGHRKRGANSLTGGNNAPTVPPAAEAASTQRDTELETSQPVCPPDPPAQSRRGRNTSRVPEGPIVAVISLGVDSDSDNGVAPVPIFPSKRGRARRDFVAKKAGDIGASAVIDLSSSLSEGETAEAETSAETAGMDASFDSINPEVSIKIWWDGKIERFPLRKYQKFSAIIKILADREETSVDNIFLILDERIIQPNDTPDSINYKVFEFISGKVIKNSVLPRPDVGFCSKKRKDPNEIELKVQSNAWKKPMMISIKKEDTFKVLYVKCAEELKLPYDSIKLYFDGDYIEFSNTPKDFELEGQEVIDCQIV